MPAPLDPQSPALPGRPFSVERADTAATAEPVSCVACETEFGLGPDRCRRAKGTDVCLDCIFGFDSADPRVAPAEFCSLDDVGDDLMRRVG